MANAAVANGLADTLSYFMPAFKKLYVKQQRWTEIYYIFL
jgi:hypothetical protein